MRQTRRYLLLNGNNERPTGAMFLRIAELIVRNLIQKILIKIQPNKLLKLLICILHISLHHNTSRVYHFSTHMTV